MVDEWEDGRLQEDISAEGPWRARSTRFPLGGGGHSRGGGTLRTRTHRGRDGLGPEPLAAVGAQQQCSQTQALPPAMSLGRLGMQSSRRSLTTSQEGARLSWKLFVEMFRGDPWLLSGVLKDPGGR